MRTPSSTVDAYVLFYFNYQPRGHICHFFISCWVNTLQTSWVIVVDSVVASFQVACKYSYSVYVFSLVDWSFPNKDSTQVCENAETIVLLLSPF